MNRNKLTNPMLTFSLTATVLTLWGGRAGAVPTLYPTQVTQLSSIKNATNSNLVTDNDDPKRIYVMPPNTASATVKGLHTANMNLGFCKEMNDIQGYSRDLTARVRKLLEEELNSQAEVKKYQEALDKARTAAADYAVTKDLSLITDLDQHIEALTTRLSELEEFNEKCTANCDAPIAEANDLRVQKNKLIQDRRGLAKNKAADVREYDRRKQRVLSARENLDDVLEQYNRLRSKVVGVQNDLRKLYSTYGKMEGARAAFAYESNWDANVDKLNSDNTGFSFERIQTSDAQVFASILNLEHLPSEGAILAFEVPGKKGDGSIELSTFPTSINGNVVLSLLGACPMAYPDMFPTTVPTSAGEMKYGMTIAYKFPSSFKLEAKATYNQTKMYEKIQKSGSKGGLFSSKSWSRVEERNFFKDSFHMNWKIQDPSNSVTEAERLEIEHEMRTQLISELATLALPFTPDRQGVVAAAKPGPHGAVVVADSLMKTCPANIYCVGGAIVLNALDAIFGSSKMTASYLNLFTADREMVMSRDIVTMKPWITVYNP